MALRQRLENRKPGRADGKLGRTSKLDTGRGHYDAAPRLDCRTGYATNGVVAALASTLDQRRCERRRLRTALFLSAFRFAPILAGSDEIILTKRARRIAAIVVTTPIEASSSIRAGTPFACMHVVTRLLALLARPLNALWSRPEPTARCIQRAGPYASAAVSRNELRRIARPKRPHVAPLYP